MASKRNEPAGRGVLSREQLLSRALPPVVSPHFGELGGVITLRAATRAQWAAIERDGERSVLAQLLDICLIEPRLEPVEIDALLAGATPELVGELDDAICRLNRLGKYQELSREEIETDSFREPAGPGAAG